MDRKPSKNDFVVETQGYCFLCLNQIIDRQFRPEHDLEGESMPPHLIYSLQCLSRHLKMDMRKVFNEKLTVPLYLLTEVENSKLKVELCYDCASVNGLFARLYQQLDKIRMEIESCLGRILEKLIGGNNSGITEQFQKMEETSATEAGKLQIVETLRNEAINNCKKKMSCVLPRVKVEKMSVDKIKITDYLSLVKVQSRTGEFQPIDDWVCSPDAFSDQSSFENAEIDISKVKEESTTLDDMDGDNMEDPDNSDFQKNDLEKLQTENATKPSFQKSERSNLTNSRTWRPRPQHAHCTIDPETRQHNLTRACYKHHDQAHLKRKYKCGECGKVFFHKSHCTRHQQDVHQGVRYKCDLCNRLFSQNTNLRVHQLRTDCTSQLTPQHLSSKRPCHCSLCGKNFEILLELLGHLKSAHWQLSEHECKVCGKKFKWKSTLNRHLLKVHSRK